MAADPSPDRRDAGAPPTSVELRRATAGDADPIRDLVRAAYEGYTPLIGRTPFPMETDQAEAIRDHEVWVLDDGARVVGVIDLIRHDDQLWVDNVAIAPDRQGRGHGRRLLGLAEDRARELGIPEMGLHTNEHYVANIAMYERYGYRETHRELRQGSDLVYFRKRLAEPG